MRILFLHPGVQASLANGNMIPTAILSLASFMKREGHTVCIYERCIDGRSLSQVMEEFKPEVVSCTLMFAQQFADMQLVCNELRSSYPDIPILCGGLTASLFPELILQRGFADYVGISEGEYTLLELLDVVAGRKEPSEVQSLVYLDQDGQPRHTPLRPFADLSDFPDTDFSLLPVDRYFAYYPEAPHALSVCASKGCPFQCTFCFNVTYHRCKYRTRDPQSVLREIESLVSDYGADGIIFIDELWGLDKEDLRTYCNGMDALREKYQKPIRFSCETRFGILREEDFRMMADSGCWLVAFGLESGSPEVLKRVKKNYPLQRVEADIQNCKKMGISTMTNVIFGFPGETPAQIKQTVHTIFRLNPTIYSTGLFYAALGSEEYNNLVIAGKMPPSPQDLESWAEMGQRQFMETNFSEIPDRELKVIHYFFYWRLLFQNRKDQKTGRLDFIKTGIQRVLGSIGRKGFIKFVFKSFRLFLYAAWYYYAFPGIRKKYDLYASSFGRKDWDDLAHLDQDELPGNVDVSRP